MRIWSDSKLILKFELYWGLRLSRFKPKKIYILPFQYKNMDIMDILF